MPRQEILNIYVDKQKNRLKRSDFMCNVCDVLTIHGPEQRGRKKGDSAEIGFCKALDIC